MQNKPEWMNDMTIKDIEEEKLSFLLSLMEESKGKSQKEIMSFFMLKMKGGRLMLQVNYEVRYRHIYMKISEFVASAGKVEVYKNFLIPIIKKIIKNYSRFRKEIADEQERMVCDEYIQSIRKILILLEKKVRCHEYNRENEFD